MRIGFFLDSYRPYMSGVVHSVDTFAAELRQLGHEVYIVAPDAPKCEDDEYTIRATSFHSPFQPTNHYLPYPVQVSLRQRINSLNLDVFHTHHMFLLGRLGAVWARQMGKPLVHMYHTLLTEYVHYVPLPPSLAKQTMVSMSRRYCNVCDSVIAPTPQVEAVLRSYGISSRIEVIPTGINLKPYEGLEKAACRREFGFGEDEFVLVWVGRLTHEKNPEFMLKSFVELVKLRPSARLVMVGGGVLEEKLRNMISELALTDTVRLTGRIPHTDIPKMCKASDVFAFASVTETQAIVIPEAMAAGIPAVAVGANGVSGMVRDGEDGFLTPLDIDAFNAALIKVMDDRELYRRMSIEALESARRFSAPNTTAKLVKLYDEVIESKKISNSRR